MVPFHAILIGCDRDLATAVREESFGLWAGVQAVYPDVVAAVAATSKMQETAILVPLIRSRTDIEDIHRLQGALPTWPILALLEDPSLVLPALRAGAAQASLLPLRSDDLSEALETIFRQFGAPRPPDAAPVIAITGVTGGCGATTLAINLAAEFVHLAPNYVILAELATRLGMVASYVEAVPKFTLADLEQCASLDAHFVRGLLTRLDDRLDAIVGPTELLTTAISSARIAELVGFLERMASVVVLDIPCTYDDRFFDALTLADHIILVGEQTVPSVRSLRVMWDTLLKGQYAWRRSPAIYVLLNKYKPMLDGFRAQQIDGLIGTSNLWTVAEEPEFTSAVNKGLTLRRHQPKSKALEDLDLIARQLFGVGMNLDTPTQTPTRWLSRFFG